MEREEGRKKRKQKRKGKKRREKREGKKMVTVKQITKHWLSTLREDPKHLWPLYLDIGITKENTTYRWKSISLM